MASLTSRPLLPSGSSQRPSRYVAPRIDETYGDLAAKFAADYGLDPDEWQRFVLDDWLGRSRGKWASLTCGLAVPRQNGKNALLEVRELFGMVGMGERILHTAHEVKTAQKHFRRLKYFFGQSKNDPGANFPELNGLVEQVRSVNGQEAIFLTNGGSIELVARSKNSGRGFTVDVLVMDEAQEMSEDALEALMPTTSAAPLGNPQWVFTGTPPGPSASGEVFTRVRQESLEERPTRLAWHEWSPLSDDVDLDDRALWRMTNPGLDSGRLQIDVIEGERARFSDGGFARERLGVWAPDISQGSRLITADEWENSGVREAPEGVKSFGVAFSFDGSRVSLAGARKHDGSDVFAELVDVSSGKKNAAAKETQIESLADWLAGRWRDTSMIAISGAAGSESLKQALVDRGVPSRLIRVLTTPEVCDASALAYEGVQAGWATHSVHEGQHRLDASVAVCDKKHRSRVSGAWTFTATTPDGDETPIEAFSFAVWAARTSKRVPGRKQVLI